MNQAFFQNLIKENKLDVILRSNDNYKKYNAKDVDELIKLLIKDKYNLEYFNNIAILGLYNIE
jgi:hypothetical protein